MIAFLMKYFPGNVFFNSAASAVSEVAACAIAGILYKFLGVRLSYQASFGIACLGGIGILVYEISTNFYSSSTSQSGWLFPFLVLFGKFGIASAFTVNYMA